MKDKYSLKKEKVANLLFDLVKYLLTTIGAIMLLKKEMYSFKALLISFVITIIVFAVAVFITPLKED
jgi:hypothetical protein